MNEPNYRSLGGKYIERNQEWERSPLIRGILSGTHGALVAAPIGAMIQAARGKNPLVGAIIGALGTGLLTGVASAIKHDVKNQVAEGDLKYYVDQLKESEPLVFMPPAPLFGRLFSRMHAIEHLKERNVTPQI